MNAPDSPYREQQLKAVSLPPHSITVLITNVLPRKLDGEYDPSDHTIRIAPDNPISAIEQTIVHEIIHALGNIFSVPELDDDGLVMRLEYPFYSFLKHNTDFFEHAMSEVVEGGGDPDNVQPRIETTQPLASERHSA